jgi:hypothetical protein
VSVSVPKVHRGSSGEPHVVDDEIFAEYFLRSDIDRLIEKDESVSALPEPFHAQSRGGEKHALAAVLYVVERRAISTELDPMGYRIQKAKLDDQFASYGFA